MEENRTSPTAEQILAAGRQRRIEDVPYLGGTVYAYGFTAPERQDYEEECVKAAGSIAADAYSDARMIVHCIRNAEGLRIFCLDHLTQIAGFNEADRRHLLIPCYAVNGIGEIGREYLAKNCETTRSGASGSESQPTTVSP